MSSSHPRAIVWAGPALSSVSRLKEPGPQHHPRGSLQGYRMRAESVSQHLTLPSQVWTVPLWDLGQPQNSSRAVFCLAAQRTSSLSSRNV